MVQTFQAYDSYGNLYQDARVEDGKVVTGSGTEVAGAYIAEDGTVYDAYQNPVSSVTVEENTLDPKAENPDIALPPAENGENADSVTTWEGAVTDDDDSVIENE